MGHTVFGIDNLSRGRLENLATAMAKPGFAFERVDMTNLADYRRVFSLFNEREAISEVWHLAANSDIPKGVEDAGVDLRDTFMTSFNTLELMKAFKVKRILFASSSAIYGDWGSKALAEDSGPLLPISNYGAMKLASEAAISAAAESFLDRAFVFRFPNVIGTPATHGVVLDFVRKLKATPDVLEVLGNGSQQKCYLHVEDLVDAMLFVREAAPEKVAVYNIGSSDEGVSVRFIAEATAALVSPGASIRFGSGGRGWVGDVPRFTYSVRKLKDLGWVAPRDSEQAMARAIRQIAAQEGVVNP